MAVDDLAGIPAESDGPVSDVISAILCIGWLFGWCMGTGWLCAYMNPIIACGVAFVAATALTIYLMVKLV